MMPYTGLTACTGFYWELCHSNAVSYLVCSCCIGSERSVPALAVAAGFSRSAAAFAGTFAFASSHSSRA